MRIVIADGHTLVREGLRSLLETHGVEVVGLAATGQDAVRLALELHPDLVLMDLAAPGIGGLEATRLISAQLLDVKVVLLTVSQEQSDLLTAVQAGALGFLGKDVEPLRLLHALEEVAHGEPALPPELVWRLIRDYGGPRPRQTRGLFEALTAREQQVVDLLAGGVTSNRDLAQRLGVSEHTIKYHLRHVLNKLRLHDRAQIISYVLR